MTRINMQLLDFLRRNNKWLPMLAAGIIFMTFVVKDGLRESAKEQLESLSKVQDTYELGMVKGEILEKLDRLQEGYGSQNGNTPQTLNGQATIYGLEVALQAQDSPETLRSLISNVRPLEEALPDRSDLKRHRTEAENEINKLVPLNLEFNTLTEEEQPSDLAKIAPPKMAHLTSELLVQHGKAFEATGVYYAFAIAAMMHEHESRQRRYETFTLWSYVLFAFGWIVGLIGKFVEPISSAEADTA